MLNLLVQAHKRKVSHSLVSTLRHLGAVGLFFFAILDSSPAPTFGGLDIFTAVLAATHTPLWYEFAATATAGSVLGAYLTFRVARMAGSAFLDKKFKKSRMSKYLILFKKWGTGTLVASTAIPLPSPTSMFFAAAGAFNYPTGRFLAIVAICRSVRYFGIAYIAALYGRHFLRVLRHPLQHWGWLLLFIAMTGALIGGGIMIGHRLEKASAN